MKTHVDFFNGQQMPIIGLGTWQASDSKEIESAVDEALKAGYRHIDTAFNYVNEEFIGKVLTEWINSGKVKREELFIVTKLPLIAMQADRVEEFLKKSLSKLNLDYVDLYLIHSPIGFLYFSDTELHPMRDGKIALDMTTDLEAIWKAMEAQVDAGRAKSIGLSNFNHKQVERIVKASRIHPANLQVEMNAYYQQKPLREFCAKHNVTLCAYAPFGSPGRKALYEKMGRKFECVGLLEDPVITHIAKTHGKTSAQVLLRFLAQQGVVVIPKSTNAERLKKNLEIFDFELTADEMKSIEDLDKGAAGRTFSMGSFPGLDQHPENPEKEPF